MRESACRTASGKSDLQVKTIEFAHIPGQSRLFLDYLLGPSSLRSYYPSAVSSITELADRVPEVLDAHEVDRQALCEGLAEINTSLGCRPRTLENIELLKRPDAVAIVTGQQTGLLTGPLYTIYKALSALRLSDVLRERGINAVPVFWMATEDHDVDEVSQTYCLDSSGGLIGLSADIDEDLRGSPVGSIPIERDMPRRVVDLFGSLPRTEFTDNIREQVLTAVSEGATYGNSFGSLLASIFGDRGLILLDPLAPRLKRLASPILSKALDRSGEIVEALTARDRELINDGYHSQVLIDEDHFPLFLNTADGKRRSLRLDRDGGYRVNGEKGCLSVDELRTLAQDAPERLSPNVMLRPVVQDFLLPTLCYFGGSAEIAYFAQNSEVYRVLERPATPILHRQSFTIIERRHARTLAKYELGFPDLFKGFDELLPRIIDRFVNPETARVLADAEDSIAAEMHRLDVELSQIDPTLAANLATRQRKIMYHIGALQKKFRRVQIEKDEIAGRRLHAAFNELLPDGRLQERTLNIFTYLNRHGPYFVDWLYESMDLDDPGHRLLYL
jgi:bacillithiol synthase